ncbi:MAG TPA: endonuclease III [Caulobacteraceae bacterium]|nr:endonuclease III [Caulobacteraceae bacterium]
MAAGRRGRKARVAQIFDRLAAENPEPRTELEYANPYCLLVAVVLSAQATDKSVNAATAKLFKVADTPEKMAALGEQGLIPFIASIGLFRTKARNVVALSRKLLDECGGQVPLRREALESLPGVGRKTASVVLNELGAEAAIAVDTHVFRVAHRLGLSKGKTTAEVEKDLMAVTPPERRTRAHHWLILHGRYTCLARRPRCERCVVADLCPSRELFLGA